MENQNQLTHIQGWGADLDHANRPAYPMERTPPRLNNIPSVERQPVKIKVLQSNERPDISPVFGTSVPPSGLSGKLREVAFKFTENDLRHWLILLFADRINVVEGVVEDLGRGHIPNIFAEMGGKAEFKYNRPAAIRKVVIAGAALGIAVYFMKRKKRA